MQKPDAINYYKQVWAVVIGPRKSIYFYFFGLHFGEYVVVRPT